MDKVLTILSSTTITAAVSGQASAAVDPLIGGIGSLTLVFDFVYGSGGTTAKVWVQTSLDGGTTWVDIANLACTTASKKRIVNLSAKTPVTTPYTPTDGTLADDTVKDGIIGPLFRTKLTTTGTYADSTTVTVTAVAKP